MSQRRLSFLRPCLQQTFKPSIRREHARVYKALQSRLAHTEVVKREVIKATGSTDAHRRITHLGKLQSMNDYYPRLLTHDDRLSTPMSLVKFHRVFSTLEKTDFSTPVICLGRVMSVRISGSKLLFLDLQEHHKTVQVMCNFSNLEKRGIDLKSFKNLSKVIRRGDFYSVTGYPTRTSAGELSILANRLPRCHAPSLHQIPAKLEDPETLTRYPHIKQLVHPSTRNTLYIRQWIQDAIRSYMRRHQFLEVQTPILESTFGGATARPFETSSKALSDTNLKLRIAPELALKRLIAGGCFKIFEIGKVFRNEGVDSTHNPEFTICEYYEVGADLGFLLKRTQELLHHIQQKVKDRRDRLGDEELKIIDLTLPDKFPRLEWFKTIEDAIKQNLPDASSPNALAEYSKLFASLQIAQPPNATLPMLLDTLAELYIEPRCIEPTFVLHPPECLVPLAKSALRPQDQQRVAASAELIIQGKELVNLYEEENSPFEQRRKFEQQIQLRANSEGQDPRGEVAAVDESYLEALEWGMPPTGGWGCGIDRLVMLFSGAQRIADVLPFGSLRNQVAMAGNKGVSGDMVMEEEEVAIEKKDANDIDPAVRRVVPRKISGVVRRTFSSKQADG